MKKRLKKKAEKARRREVHKLLDLVLDINGLSERSREFAGTGDLPTAFFEFSGHVSRVYVTIHRNGWESGAKTDFKEDAKVLGNRDNVFGLFHKASGFAADNGLLN